MMSDFSLTVHSRPSSSFSVEESVMELASNARIKMQPEVYEAAETGSLDLMWLCDNWKQEKTATGNNVLHVHVGKPLEIRKGVVTDHVSMAFIQFVIDETSEKSAVLHSNDNGDTPLHFGARFGHTGAVQEFLKRSELINAGLLDKANKWKDTALHDATRRGHADIVMLLVEAGDENSLHHMPNYLGETPLLLAAERGCFESFTALARHSSLTTLEHNALCGQTALHLAVLRGNKDIVNRILQIDTSSLLIRVKNDQGQTPLHCCAAQNVKEQRVILKALLNHDDKYNSAAYIQDNEGQTPLHIATKNSNFNGAKILIRFYPDCIEMVDNRGWNMVHFAAKLGSLHSFELFLRKAPKCDRLINEKDNEGNTPLHLLVATKPRISMARLRLLSTKQNNLDMGAFNSKNLTAGDSIDIFASKEGHKHLAEVRQNRRTLLPQGRRIMIGVNKAEDAERSKTIGNVHVLENTVGREKKERKINRIRKVGETHLLVAALIATMSFTAGFTLPGGFDQSPGKTIGLALLAKKPSFITFLVADTIAFTLSSIAVICYFTAAVKNNLEKVTTLSGIAYWLNTISLGALVIAYVAGVCTVISLSPRLTHTIIAISMFYFLSYLILLLKLFKTSWIGLKRAAEHYP